MMSILEKFDKIIGLNSNEFISSYTSFATNNVGRINNYYTGIEEKPDVVSFKLLDSLISQSDVFNMYIINNIRRFSVAEFWDVIELFDDIRTNLKTVSNMSKWTRSTTATGDLNTNPEIPIVLEAYNTLEMLASKSGEQDPNNDWVKIALRNDLDEDKYSSTGGNVLKINVSNGNNMIIDDVVDSVFDESMKGKDINAVIKYVNNDFDVVSGDKCIYQMYNTMLKMKRGDNPELPDMGLGSIIGGNVAMFSYPTVLRQLHRTFYTDSSVKSVAISNVNVDGDGMKLEVLISSKFGDILKKGAIL